VTTPHDEIRQLLQRYARAVDERDIEALSDLFHPEAEITGSRGTQSREEWLTDMRAPRSFPHSMHMIGEPLITLDGDGDGEQATADTYAVVYQLGDHGAGQADLTLGMRYLDRLVVLGSAWVIARRHSTMVWMR
jgi:ketosteroid isomerase-like protein